MAVQQDRYNHVCSLFLQGALALASNTIKLALLDDTYSFDADHTSFATDCQPSEITGTGYTAGGEALTNASVSIANTNGGLFDADDVTWSSATITCRYGILYDATTDNVLLCILFDDTPADIGVVNAEMTIQISSDGIMLLS